MKTLLCLTMLIVILFASLQTSAQNATQNYVDGETYLVMKQNGAIFIGEILFEDAREILIRTKDLGDVYIPRHVIEEIKLLLPDTGGVLTDELFSTRYFITTNGLPIKQGENYIQWNLYGPDFQFGIRDNFGVGIMTSWAAIPIIANAKYSIQLKEKISMSVGALLGTGSWAMPEFGLMLPFATYTLGNRTNNLNFSFGYGLLFYEGSKEFINGEGYLDFESYPEREGRILYSFAGLKKINEKFSIVFDTFISPRGPEKTRTEYEYRESYNQATGTYNYNYVPHTVTEKSPALAIILPGIRWQLDKDRAFQFGFTGVYFDGEFIEAPLPMVQWYRRL